MTNPLGVQCPKCRAISYPGLMGFPRCHRCHEQLRQCRYCLHQTAGLCHFDPAHRPQLEVEDGKPFCAAFESRLRVGQPGRDERAFGTDLRVLGATGAMLVVLVWLLATLLGGEHHGLRVEPDDDHVYVEAGRAVANFTLVSEPLAGQVITLRADPAILRDYSIDAPTPDAWRTGGPQFRVTLSSVGRAHLALVLARRGQAAGRDRLRLAWENNRGAELAHGEVEIVDSGP